jgi:short-subunit dehydrogenase
MTPFKTVLITGASSGIGKHLAWEFASRGHNLVLFARREDLLLELKQEITTRHAVQVFVRGVDVTEETRLNEAVNLAEKELGPVDTVIANAGYGVAGKFEELSVRDYVRQFEVNVFGTLKTLSASLPNLKRTHGRLCLIGSTSAYLTIPGNSAYCMSKFAIRSLAEALHSELAPYGISVTLINPGFIDTPIRRTDNQGVFRPSYQDPIPSWLMMSPQVAAQKIYRTISQRKREKALTLHSSIGIFAARFMPNVIAFIFKKIANRSAISAKSTKEFKDL